MWYFMLPVEEIIDIAVKGTQMVKDRAAAFPGKIVLEYSPESFTGTELDLPGDLHCGAGNLGAYQRRSPLLSTCLPQWK